MSESIGDDWIDVVETGNIAIVDFTKYPDDILQLLKEAQSESAAVSARITPRKMSPSPICHVCSDECINYQDTDLILSDVYINNINDDFIFDWSSSPLIAPPKHWKLQRKISKTSKDLPTKDKKQTVESYLSLFLTNLISLIIGTGIGVMLYKRNNIKQLYTSIFN